MSDYIKEYKKGDVIFREGEDGDTMYYITGFSGEKVGIYSGYETNDQFLITTLSTGKFFGEMSVLDNEKRSATAVALTDIKVAVITKKEFREYFTENRASMIDLIKQVSANLRRLTDDYMKACELVCDYVTAKSSGQPIDNKLKSRLKALCD